MGFRIPQDKLVVSQTRLTTISSWSVFFLPKMEAETTHCKRKTIINSLRRSNSYFHFCSLDFGTSMSFCQEVFVYRLRFDTHGKISAYEVWADSGAAHVSSMARKRVMLVSYEFLGLMNEMAQLRGLFLGLTMDLPTLVLRYGTIRHIAWIWSPRWIVFIWFIHLFDVFFHDASCFVHFPTTLRSLRHFSSFTFTGSPIAPSVATAFWHVPSSSLCFVWAAMSQCGAANQKQLARTGWCWKWQVGCELSPARYKLSQECDSHM